MQRAAFEQKVAEGMMERALVRYIEKRNSAHTDERKTSSLKSKEPE